MEQLNTNQSLSFFRGGFFVLWVLALMNMGTSTLRVLTLAVPCFYWWMNGRKGVVPRIRVDPPMITWTVALIAVGICFRTMEWRDDFGRSQWGSAYSVETTLYSEGGENYADHTADTGSFGGNVLLWFYVIGMQLAAIGGTVWTYRIEQSWPERLSMLVAQEEEGD